MTKRDQRPVHKRLTEAKDPEEYLQIWASSAKSCGTRHTFASSKKQKVYLHHILYWILEWIGTLKFDKRSAEIYASELELSLKHVAPDAYEEAARAARFRASNRMLYQGITIYPGWKRGDETIP